MEPAGNRRCRRRPVVGVHAAVAVHRHADDIDERQPMVAVGEGEIGNEEVVAVAVEVAARREARVGTAREAARRAEDGAGDIELDGRVHEAGRVERGRGRIAAVGDTSSGKRLLTRTVAVLEITLGRLCRRGQRKYASNKRQPEKAAYAYTRHRNPQRNTHPGKRYRRGEAMRTMKK